MQKKILFYFVWFALLLIGPITIHKTTPIPMMLADSGLMISLIQRLTGLLAFTLLFIQIMLGSNMIKMTEKFGGWIFKFHLTQGALTYVLILIHPIFFVLLNFRIKGDLDPFYVFTDVCILCKNKAEFFYTFGRVGFWLTTTAVAAAALRVQPWFRVHWRKFHILNYFTFFLVGFHGLKVGTDFSSPPFVWFAYISETIVLLTLVYKIAHKYLPNIRKTSL